jgi:hypothetical protein
LRFQPARRRFLLAALVEKRRSLRVVFADLRTFALMNLFTALAWLSYFQSLRTLERRLPMCCMPASVR